MACPLAANNNRGTGIAISQDQVISSNSPRIARLAVRTSFWPISSRLRQRGNRQPSEQQAGRSATLISNSRMAGDGRTVVVSCVPEFAD
jgi:hypothetical protein